MSFIKLPFYKQNNPNNLILCFLGTFFWVPILVNRYDISSGYGTDRWPKLKEDSKCQTCANQQTDKAEDCPGIELNDQSLEILEKFCYLGETISVREGAGHSFVTRIGWSKIRDLVSLLAGNCVPIGAKGRLGRLYW